MSSKKIVISTAILIFFIGILFGSFAGENFGLVGINTSVGLLDISLVVVAFLGPFLAVEHASTFISRDIRTEIACIQQYKIIDDIDRLIRKIVRSTDGKTAMNTVKEDLVKWIALASELEELASSPWLSPKSVEELLSWTHNFINSCSASIGNGAGNSGVSHTEIMMVVSNLSASRRKYFNAFIQDVKATPI